MNYANESAAPSSGPACWPHPFLSDSLQLGFSESVSISLPRYRAAFTSSAIRPAQSSWSSALKVQRPPSPSAVNIALRVLAPMAERPFSNPPSRFPATKWR